ncbi:N-acetylglucosamine kinase [Gallibacterium anatis]|uniref:N-acetyl-D-glucosamine kinase n=1 Tax=Gallibacterium anatis TaxID=750 RepID=A0A0A2XMZ2_9PAST|nr:N-acetylglucosamine kinase [Gallibacterium anatis]KGQ33671.1 N-acetylglucosamine kinase [Gallibacterium anatis]KGQ40983.1 N-acetylglucosamine kinase [Gallibacterium anatis]
MLYGIDIGGTKIELAAFNQQLERLYSERINTPQTSYEDWLNAVVQLVKKADQKFGCKGTVGIGVPGFVRRDTGIAEITNIRVADNQPIVRDLEQRLQREVRVENDANCFALSEAWDEESKQYSTVLGLIIGTGFGGGLVFNGKVHSGKVGMAGEVGHIQLNYHALKLLGWDNAPIYRCGCGNIACLDTYLSGRGFELLHHDLLHEKLSAKEIIQRFYQNDAKTVEFVEKFIELMAISIGNLITVLDPDAIFLGGGLSNFDYIYEALPKRLPQHLMRSAVVPAIRKAKYGDSGGVRGAAALFLSRD